MSKNINKPKDRQIGKTKLPGKKHLIDPRYSNTFWTAVVVIILIIFFIVNNTRYVPETGPYPPGYSPASQPAPDSVVADPLKMEN